jgi:hypothetical protein
MKGTRGNLAKLNVELGKMVAEDHGNLKAPTSVTHKTDLDAVSVAESVASLTASVLKLSSI